MGKLIQNNFSGGVISPSLYGRSDMKAYYKGAAIAENFLVTKEGSLRKRKGIHSLTRLPQSISYDTCKIMPYKYDRTQGGILLLFFQDSSLYASLYDKLGNLKVDKLLVASGDTYADDIHELQTKQIGDEIWVSNGYIFKVITVDNTQEVMGNMTVRDWIPSSKPEEVSSVWCIPSKETDQKRIYYSAYIVVDGVMSSRVDTDVGWDNSWVAGESITIKVKIPKAREFDYIVLSKKTGGTYGQIAKWYPEDMESENVATDEDGTDNYVVQFKDENIVPGEAIYTQTNVLGEGFQLPLCVDCFQQRKVFANGENDEGYYPMTLWFSEVGNLNNFYADRPMAEDDPFSSTIATTGPAFIRWVVAYQELLVLFTDSGIFTVGFSQQQGFSAGSCRITRISELAISPTIQPIIAECGVVFVSADNKTLYTASYDLNENMLKPVNRSVLVEHLTRKAQIKAITLQESPDNVVWLALKNGRYATFTFEKNEDVYAWSDGCIKDAQILDVCSTHTCTDNQDDRTQSDIFFIVRKNNRDYIATLAEDYYDTIENESTPVTATLETLRPESQEQTLVGAYKNVKDAIVRLFETGDISIVPTDAGPSVDLVSARMKKDPQGLFTGEVKIMPRGIANEHGQMTFLSQNPTPCEILQIIISMETHL